MKNLKLKSVLSAMLLLLSFTVSYAVNPSYEIKVDNINRVAPNAIEFDINLIHTNPADTKFEYFFGQYFFDFNSGIANGGTLSLSIVKSDLPDASRPSNPTVTGNQLRLATNSIPNKDNLPVISDKTPGTLIARVRLQTSAESFSNEDLNLKMRTGPEVPFTKVAAKVGELAVDITSSKDVNVEKLGKDQTTSEIPKTFALNQNYPNPFNPTTNISFDIPLLSNVKLSVYDITGREISVLANEVMMPGSYTFKFNGNNFASGIYFFRISAQQQDSKAGQNFVQTRKMVLIK